MMACRALGGALLFFSQGAKVGLNTDKRFENPLKSRRKKYGDFYKSSAWGRRRKAQLRREPLCRICLSDHHRQTVATVADHISPIWDNFDGFLAGELQSLCASCHRQKTAFQDIKSLLKQKKTQIKKIKV